MHSLTLLSVTLLFFFASVGSAQEKDAPREPSPLLWLASASQYDGKVVIQLAKPKEQGGRGPVRNLEPGTKSLPAPPVMKWSNLEKVILGKTVRAFRVNGKLAEPNYVLKALAKPRGVAVFVRTEGREAPDPFYLAMFREDTLVLVVDFAAINPVKEP